MAIKIDPETQQKIRTAIKQYLQVHMITEIELADKMGKGISTVRNYLSKSKISAGTVKLFSDALGYPYSMLIRGEYWEGETEMKKLERRIKEIEDFLWPDGKH